MKAQGQVTLNLGYLFTKCFDYITFFANDSIEIIHVPLYEWKAQCKLSLFWVEMCGLPAEAKNSNLKKLTRNPQKLMSLAKKTILCIHLIYVKKIGVLSTFNSH